MQIWAWQTELKFNHPFVLASGTRTFTRVIFLKMEYNGKTGWAEAALPPYLGLEPEEIYAEIRSVFATPLPGFTSYLDLDTFICNTGKLSNPARSLLVNAFYTMQPFTGEITGSYKTTFTVSPSPGVATYELLRHAGAFSMLKLKTGTGSDIQRMSEVLQHTHKLFCVDVNQGWKTRHEALEIVRWLESRKCVVIEQPFSKHDYESHQWLRNQTSIPIIADESIQGLEELEKYGECFSGINIKLLKCGGMAEAEAMIKRARDMNIMVLVGCMSESSLGCSTAARLGAHADFLDLDGPWLISNDAFRGFSVRNGKFSIGHEGITAESRFLSAFSAHAVKLSG